MNDTIKTMWNSESTAKSALFTNIFKVKRCDMKWLEKVHKQANRLVDAYKEKHPWQQNNIIAVEERMAGNEFFAQEKYIEAMECYNRSLCFGEIGATNNCLAYANRSVCFFNMKMYDKCLVDIELAIGAGYPQHLMEKLIKRRSDAERFISEGISVQGQKNVSFVPNEYIPQLANSVGFDRDDKGDSKLIATENLKAGQIILLEPFYVGESYVGKYTTCNICLKSKENLIPCPKCVLAMFCHGKCENNILHRIECGITPCMIVTDLDSINYRIPMIRSIYSAAKIFPTIDAMMQFVKEAMVSESLDINELKSAESKYQVFLKMKAETFSKNAIPSVFSLYKTILSQADIAGIFNTEKYRRFLMHLVMQHFLIINKNAIIFQFNSLPAKNILEIGFTVLASQFKHSCAPNVTLVLNNGSIVGTVVRPVENGEQLTFNRFNSLPDSYSERRKLLLMLYGIQCECERCELRSETFPDSNMIMSLNPDFRFIGRNYYSDPNFYLYEKSEILEEKCVSFLNQYGREKWCIEIAVVIRLLICLLSHCAVTSHLSKYNVSFNENENEDVSIKLPSDGQQILFIEVQGITIPDFGIETSSIVLGA